MLLVVTLDKNVYICCRNDAIFAIGTFSHITLYTVAYMGMIFGMLQQSFMVRF